MSLFRAASDNPGDPAPASACGGFREVFQAHARFVWRVLLGLGVLERDVPDASQQVFLVLSQKLGQLDPACPMRTFVYGICLRVAADFRNRAHVRRERLFAEAPEPQAAATQEEILSSREALRRLQDALDRIDPAQREVFVLYEIEDLGMAEIAAALGCPLQTAYSRLHAARKSIAAAMGEPLADDGISARRAT
jgi:RNA polymerase sigma-70 factor (ECF subfamily)